MERRTQEIPVWPANNGCGPRRMCFLSSEARWYLWFQEENKQGISALRRDLLLLHQNGDLELFQGNEPPHSGTYLTALHEGRMIRGRVCSDQTSCENSKSNIEVLNVIDLDEGRTLQVHMSQVRVLPPEMKSLPCQAVRCDIGLDCKEQFKWPTQINDMLHKALDRVFVFVENSSNRPGSVPTISGKVTIVSPTTGQSVAIQKWLMETFSNHLEICSFEEYKPYPVGISGDNRVQSVVFHQQGFGMFNHSGPPRFPVLPQYMPSTAPTVTMGVLTRPAMPVLPQPSLVPSNHILQSPNMIPFNPNVIPSSYNMMPPNPSMMQSNHHPMSHQNFAPLIPTPSGSKKDASIVSFQYLKPLVSKTFSSEVVELPQTPSGQPSTSSKKHAEETLDGRQSSSVLTNLTEVQETSNRQLPSVEKKASSESDSSPTLSSDEFLSSALYESDASHNSLSTVGIELEHNITSSSSAISVHRLNPEVKPYVPRAHCALGVTSTNEKTRQKEQPPSPNLSCKQASREVTQQSMNSTLKVNAPSFTPSPSKVEKTGEPLVMRAESSLISSSEKVQSKDTANLDKNSQRTENRKSSSSNYPLEPLSSSSPAIKYEKGKDVNHATSKKRESSSTPVKSQSTNCIEAGPSTDFPTGKDVELVQIVQKWKVGDVIPAFMAKVWNLSCFEVNVVDEQCSFLKRIEDEMEEYYASKQITISSKQQAQDLCGNFCACYDTEEGNWFRAEVAQWFQEDSITPVKVWSVDYGGILRVDLSCIQPLMTELACTSPILVTHCAMKNIIPSTNRDIWPGVHLNRVKEFLPCDKLLYLRVDGPKSSEGIWPVSVFYEPNCSMDSINEMLVAEGCASYIGGDSGLELTSSLPVDQAYEDDEDPMEEAFKVGGNNYEYDDEDACLAVSGLKATDEKSICWFYNKHGYCYKNLCTLKHVRLDPDGYTIEKQEMYVRSFEELVDSVLTPGKILKLTVTRIITVNHFIARVHIGRGTPGISSRETLKSMLQNLNSPEMKRSLKAFTEYPADGEIVLFKDKTGTFYRGRVVSSDEVNDDLYEVLNVDTGYLSKVPIQDLRKVDPAFLHHPFQLIECWLADVAPSQTDREWTKTCNHILADLVKNEKLTAVVVRSAPWGIEVNLTDKNGQDIAVILKEMDVVKSCPMRHLPVTQSPYIPG